MQNINIIQFLPYFPPHKWWLESHAQEWSSWWTQKWYWNVLNVTFSVWQGDNWKLETRNWKLLIIPAFDLIPNFPFPKFWKKEFWKILKEAKNFSKAWKLETENLTNCIVITRTRFFLSSLIWWLFSKRNDIKWVHIEHWSDFVKLNAKWKNLIAYIYDILIWKWIFKYANILIWVSNACKIFIKKEFINKDVNVMYRWIEKLIELKNAKLELRIKFKNKIIIWFVWRLYKWKNVNNLIRAYYLLDINIKNKIQIVIIWEWEDLKQLQWIDKNNEIYFSWWQTFKNAIKLQNQFDIHVHSSAPWGGLATTLLQAMWLWCLIVATPYEWANEVIKNNYNWILLKDCSIVELKKWIELWINNLQKKMIWWKINKKYIEEKFNWCNNIEKYYYLFNKK